MESHQSVIVNVNEEMKGKIDHVVADLKRAGLSVGRVLHDLGFIQGTISPEKLQALSKVHGVSGVRPELTFHTGR